MTRTALARRRPVLVVAGALRAAGLAVAPLAAELLVLLALLALLVVEVLRLAVFLVAAFASRSSIASF